MSNTTITAVLLRALLSPTSNHTIADIFLLDGEGHLIEPSAKHYSSIFSYCQAVGRHIRNAPDSPTILIFDGPFGELNEAVEACLDELLS